MSVRSYTYKLSDSQKKILNEMYYMKNRTMSEKKLTSKIFENLMNEFNNAEQDTIDDAIL